MYTCICTSSGGGATNVLLYIVCNASLYNTYKVNNVYNVYNVYNALLYITYSKYTMYTICSGGGVTLALSLYAMYTMSYCAMYTMYT